MSKLIIVVGAEKARHGIWLERLWVGVGWALGGL